MQRFRKILKLISVPLILLVIYFFIALIWKIFNFPSDQQLIKITTDYFNRYGLLVVFISALIEGFLLLGQYFPGSFIIFLGVISAGKDVFKASEVVAIVSLAFFISYTLNYWVGKYGWYKLLVKFGLKKSLEDAQGKITKQGMNAIFFSYWEPNLASLTATAAGILQAPLAKFSLYSLIGVVIWNIFWGTLVYSLGSFALQITGLKYILIIFVIWAVTLIMRDYYLRHKKNIKFFDYLKSANKSLFRFESLQDYKIDGEDTSDEGMKDWWSFVASKTKAGVKMQRVRLVILPITNYTKMELEIHKKSKTFGDDIQIIEEDKFKSLQIKQEDFWLIDDLVCLKMNYSALGEYIGFTLENNVDTYIKVKNSLLENSIEL